MRPRMHYAGATHRSLRRGVGPQSTSRRGDAACGENLFHELSAGSSEQRERLTGRHRPPRLAGRVIRRAIHQFIHREETAYDYADRTGPRRAGDEAAGATRAALRLPSRLFISGAPGAGKSEFIKWLVTTHQFSALDGDDEQQKFLVHKIVGMARRGIALPIKVYGWFRSPLVIETGYDPTYWGPLIRTMSAAGFEAWWFDADRADARRAFQARRGNTVGFEPQWIRIEWNRAQIEALYGTHIINILHDGKHMPPTEIAAVIGQTA